MNAVNLARMLFSAMSGFSTYCRLWSAKPSCLRANGWLSSWVLAHEAGHAQKGHAAGHFAPVMLPKTQREAVEAQTIEAQADEEAVLLLARTPVSLDSMLIKVFNAQYLAAYGKSEKPGNGLVALETTLGTMVPYKLYGTHPHWTVRAASILARSAQSHAVRHDAQWFLQYGSGAPDLIRDIYGNK
jgi:hypothetical protein